MKTYTKKKIIEFYKKKAKFNKTINDNLPLLLSVLDDLEKPQFEPWRWYVHNHHYMLFNPLSSSLHFGFNPLGVWYNCKYRSHGDWQLAIKEQIEPLIRAEAERRGFVEGAKFNSVPEFEGCRNHARRINKSEIYNKPVYDFEDDCLFNGYGVIYEKGRWATLVEEKSLEDRVAELEKEVKRLNEKLCQD